MRKYTFSMMTWKQALKWLLLVTLGPQLIWLLLIVFSGGRITPNEMIKQQVDEWAKEHGYHRVDDPSLPPAKRTGTTPPR